MLFHFFKIIKKKLFYLVFFLCEKTILKMENNKKNFNFLVKKILNQKKKIIYFVFFYGKKQY